MVAPVERFSIRFQGLKSFGRFFPKCRIGQAEGSNHARLCRRAKLGGGTVDYLFGASDDQSRANPCVLDLTLYNLGDGLALRLDGSPPACPLQIGQALHARFKSQCVGGRPGTALNFTVPESLKHPVEGIDNSVARVRAVVSRKTRRVRIKRKRRKVSVLSSIACAGRKRTIQVRFTDESGDTVPADARFNC